jgi:hypothetical protein
VCSATTVRATPGAINADEAASRRRSIAWSCSTERQRRIGGIVALALVMALAVSGCGEMTPGGDKAMARSDDEGGRHDEERTAP